ncbi:hypothetical protein [Kutzneria buriramensis]|uniref:hypothetical protein n=1 Tax=Kutzneria buriramensis TaxID=1045776 RepID=UPI0011C0D8E3|nr:hypothetical protein [Kutzneria buriramensis]
MTTNWVLDEGFSWSADKLHLTRQLAKRFLTEVAGELFRTEIALGARPYFVPSEAISAGICSSDATPAFGDWLASAEAERVARARLTYLEPPVGELAIQVGANLRTRGIGDSFRAPTPYGLVLCPSGLGYTSDGMQLVAAHWGPAVGGGWWITWWADMRSYVAWTREQDPEPDLWTTSVGHLGLLHYIHATETIRARPAPGGWGGEYLHDANQAGPETRGALAALTGVWHLLAGDSVARERLVPTAAEADSDRRFGIVPSQITRVWLPETDDPDRLWDRAAGPV